MIRVKRLGAGDLCAMRAVNALFGEVFEDLASYASAPPDDAYLGKLLANEAFVALAAWDADVLVGALAGYELVKFESRRSEFYIYDLAVRAAYRRRGVATALIEALKPIARAAGGWMILVQADPADAPAIALYDKLGAREDVLHFDINPCGDR